MVKKIQKPPKSYVWGSQEGYQRKFLASVPIFEVLGEGTRGGGKTDTLLMDFFQDVNKGYGEAWKGILFRQTYKQLSDVISKSKRLFYTACPGAKFNSSEHFWLFPGGEMLYFRQYNKEDDYWNYHGHEYPWVAWEELCNWSTLDGYLRMMSTCRSSHPEVSKKIRYRATTNPYGPGHNVVKHRFRLPHSRGKPIVGSVDKNGNPEPPRLALFSDLKENKVLLKSDPNYINRLRASARNKSELAAWEYGDWNIVAGGMFDDVWDPATHIIKAFDIPQTWKIDRSFDWGSSAPFSVGWWAQSDGSDYRLPDGRWKSSIKGDLFRIGEWYGWTGEPNKGLTMLAKEIALGVVEREIMMGLDGRVRAGPADSSIFNEENGNCIARDMSENVRLKNGQLHRGVMFLRADKSPGSRKAGWDTVRQYFKNAVRPKDKPREHPGLFVFESCDQFIRTLPVLPRDQKDLDDVDSSTEDHIADEVRYRVRASSGIKAGNIRTVGLGG